MKNFSISELVDEQGLLTCPICGKKFKPDDDTKYIIAGGYTCSWKCFLKEAKRRSEEKKAKEEARAKRSK